jgi:hypothetical protein
MKTMGLSETIKMSAWDIEEVASFDSGKEDILILKRLPVPGIEEAVASALVRDFRSKITGASSLALARESLTALNIKCAQLAFDIALLADTFLVQFGIKEAFLRVEVVHKATCPKFHCDNVRVRLVANYFGPSTEYVHTDAPEAVCSAPPFSLVFLKGQKHPNHAYSVHHRSPQVPLGSKRLCVVLDF